MSKSTKTQDLPDHLVPVPSQNGEVYEDTAHDAVFGEITEDGPNYRDVSATQSLTEKWKLTLHRSAGWARRP